MTATWLWGLFGDGHGTTRDGSISMDNVLTVGHGTDKVTIDVRGEASASLNISRDDLPANWKTEALVTGRTMIALVDGDKVLFAGYLNKINSNMNGSKTLVVNGLKAYMARQQTNNTYGITETDPDAATVFKGLGFTGLLADVVRKCFSIDGVPDGVRPANVLGDFVADTTDIIEQTYESKHSGFETHGTVMDTITDSLSKYGVEVWFVPRWENTETLDRIVWDVVIGDDATLGTAHINENIPVVLDASQVENGFSSLADLSITYSVEQIASRYLAQSRFGDTDAGVEADITSKTNTTLGIPRFDTAYNPEAMLSLDDMDERLTRLLDVGTEGIEVNLNILEDWTTEWLTRLGCTVELKKSIDDVFGEEFSLFVRCTGITFSASTSRVEVAVEPLLPRFLRMKDKKRDKPIKVDGKEPVKDTTVFSSMKKREIPLSNIPSNYAINIPQPNQASEKSSWWGAGANLYGELGVGTDTETANHKQLQRADVPSNTDFVDIFQTNGITHGITENGLVYGWGGWVPDIFRMDTGPRVLPPQAGIDGLVKDSMSPRRAYWFGNQSIKKIAYPDSETVIALLADGSEIIQVSIGEYSLLHNYMWDNPPAPIVDIAAMKDVVYAVLNDGTLWAKGNGVWLGAGITAPVRVMEWTRCQQTDGVALGNIRAIHVLDPGDTDLGHVRAIVAESNFGALYRINAVPENQFIPQAWFKSTVLSGADKVGLGIKGIYYLNGNQIFHRTFADLEADEEIQDFQDASDFKEWIDFSIHSYWSGTGFDGLAKETIIGVSTSGVVWVKGMNTHAELGTGDKQEQNDFVSIPMDSAATKVKAFTSSTFIKTN
jgi:hypothetical protein